MATSLAIVVHSSNNKETVIAQPVIRNFVKRISTLRYIKDVRPARKLIFA